MSELKSLYVKIKTKKENIERFFQDKPAAPVLDKDWTSWWDSRKMYSQSPLTAIPFYQKQQTNRAVFDFYLKDPQTGTIEEQKEEQGEWEFSILSFSENFYEILPMLAWLRSIATYLDAEDEGVAIIYDFVWGSGSVMAHVGFAKQQAALKLTKKTSEIDPNVLSAANNTLLNAMKAIEAQWKGAS